MAKNSPNKRKSQNNVVQTPKKQKLNEVNQKTPKGGNKKNTPKNQKKNVQKEKLQKFSGTADLQEKVKDDIESSGEESDYEVELEVKPEKISKTMNENNQDSDEVDDSEDQDDDDDEDDDDNEETENAVNENSENDEKKDIKKNANSNSQPKVDKTEELKAFIESETAKGKKMRYVLFIGNLPYVITEDEVKNHFKNGIDIKSVRLPHKKGGDKKLRGFGYLEVSDKESYLKAFSMHHTFLKGRRINVLYTTGGKKNSANIKEILKKKNFKLNALRKEGKLEGCQKHSQKRSVRRAKKRSFEKKTE